jgi:hypothetical protein
MCGGSWHTYVVAVAFVLTIVTCGAPAWQRKEHQQGGFGNYQCTTYAGPWGYTCSGENCNEFYQDLDYCWDGKYRQFSNVADYNLSTDAENAWRAWKDGTALAISAGALSLISNAAVYCKKSPNRWQRFIVFFFTLLAVLGTVISFSAFDDFKKNNTDDPSLPLPLQSPSDYFVCFGFQVVAFVFFFIAALWDLKGLFCGSNSGLLNGPQGIDL